jgi:membrane protein
MDPVSLRGYPGIGVPVDTVDRMASDSVRTKTPPVSRLLVLRNAGWRLVTATVAACLRHRVTGLAAEAAFFAVLSLPPLVFGLAGSVAYIVGKVDPGQIDSLQATVIDLSGKVLTQNSVHRIVEPTLRQVLNGTRFDVISVGFVLSLWSGSRALNVFVDTITIMYGLAGRRGIVRTRMLSFTLYVLGLLVGVIVLPLVVAGPQLVDRVLTPRLDFLNDLYWPIVIVLSIAFLTTLFHLSVPVRSSWRYDAPGAVLAFAMWLLGSYLLRLTLETATTSIYGPLAAPIAVLLWLYLTALAVLIGAALNASFDRVWPEASTAGARLEVLRRLRRRSGSSPRPDDVADA